MVNIKMSKNHTRCTNLLYEFKNIDQYSETIQLNFDGGKAFFKTYIGASMTLLLTIIVTTFGAMRFTQMIAFTNAQV